MPEPVLQFRAVPRRPDLCRLVLSGRSIGVARREALEKMGVRAGEVPDDRAVRAVRAAVSECAATEAALKLVTRRARFSGDVAMLLRSKGHDGAAVRAAIATLERLGGIDDAALAESLCRSAVQKGTAAVRIAAELERRGAEKYLSEQVLEEFHALDQVRATALAREAVAKSRAIDIRAANRVVGLLARRGFSEEICREAVREACAERGFSIDC